MRTGHWLLLLLITLLSMPVADANPRQARLVMNNWVTQNVVTLITAELLSKKGFTPAFVDSTSADQWYLFQRNEADIQMEVWQGTMEADFSIYKARGVIIDAGNHDASTREEWWYPDYVEELCPGLPDWKALRACSEIFSTEFSPKGVYYAGPWEKYDHIRVQALKLDFKVIELPTEGDLWDRLYKAVNAKEPIVLFNWTPNWVEREFDGRFVEFPEYDEECESNPAWGVNKDWTWDCGNPKGGWLKKVVRTGYAEQNPCAFELIQRITFTGQALSRLAWLVEVYQYSPYNAASKWLEWNEKLWQKWLDYECVR